MKKCFFMHIITIVIVIFLLTPFMDISNVNAADINYNITYNTELKISLKFKQEGASQRPLETHRENFDVNITDPKFTTAIEDYKQQALKQASTLEPRTSVCDRNLSDGYIGYLNGEKYFRFFELPTDFSGTKVIIKDGLPFTITGDGNGTLSFKIESDIIGIKEQTLIIPAEFTYSVKEELYHEYYYAHYLKANSKTEYIPTGAFDSYSSNSLEDVLDHCEKNADPEKEIQISAYLGYSVYLDTEMSHVTKLNVTYGNSPKKDSANSSIDASQESATTQNTTSKTEPAKTVSTILPKIPQQQNQKETIDNPSQTEQVQTEAAEDLSQTNKDKTSVTNKDVTKEITSKKADKKTEKSSKNTIILLCVIFFLSLSTCGILMIKRIKKK